MANPPKPWTAEYAKSGRSSCKTCKSPIGKDILRLGKMVQSTNFDGFMPRAGISDKMVQIWLCAACSISRPSFMDQLVHHYSLWRQTFRPKKLKQKATEQFHPLKSGG